MVDLHTHSYASDGELSPKELITLSASAGIKVLALTDHDTIDGLDEAFEMANTCGIQLIRGFETDLKFKPGEFHLLALGLKKEKTPSILPLLKSIQLGRAQRNHEMVQLMQENNLTITIQDLEALAGGSIVGRVHFAQWLINNGIAKDFLDVFRRFLTPGCPYYLPKKYVPMETVINAIHAAGGKAVLAHPRTLRISWGRLKKNLPEWKEQGLDGIEAYHSGASIHEAERFTALALENSMFITGGSDYHGPTLRPDRKIGHGAGGLSLNTQVIDLHHVS